MMKVIIAGLGVAFACLNLAMILLGTYLLASCTIAVLL